MAGSWPWARWARPTGMHAGRSPPRNRTRAPAPLRASCQRRLPGPTVGAARSRQARRVARRVASRDPGPVAAPSASDAGTGCAPASRSITRCRGCGRAPRCRPGRRDRAATRRPGRGARLLHRHRPRRPPAARRRGAVAQHPQRRLGAKALRYAEAGCPRYWVVDPDEPSPTVWELRAGRYVQVLHVVGDDTAHVAGPLPVRFCSRPGEVTLPDPGEGRPSAAGRTGQPLREGRREHICHSRPRAWDCPSDRTFGGREHATGSLSCMAPGA